MDNQNTQRSDDSKNVRKKSGTQGTALARINPTENSPEAQGFFASRDVTRIMRTAPGISTGELYSQDEIEEVFDTGFGYQISGINPRRDEQDNRYVLLFANEDGPYDDNVTEGKFEYIGEGLSGDQSKSSPGNSVLIDATSSGIPIHFFYQDEAKKGWEYQGLVDVLSYDFEHRGGREVLVFQLEHRE